MESSLPLMFAAIVGFGHAFEADHLIAVSNIVTKREKLTLAIKDGIYWGLGHTSTIIMIGIIMILGKATFLNGYFGYFEGIVGLMLVILGMYRLYQYKVASRQETVIHPSKSDHHLAYGVGLVHGLAGSGAMILLVMTEIQESTQSMIYLMIFGVGSVVGMFVAAGLFSLPFSKRITKNAHLQLALIVVSSCLCMGYGTYIMIENWM